MAAEEGAPGRPASLIEATNRRSWSAPATVGELAALTTWTDPGEPAVLHRVAADVRSRPLLDLGVGAGRTTPVLRLLSDDYVALDYTPELVELCRRRHPDADVRLGDARDLSQFPDATFALVYFSFNGIDAVDHDDRGRILAECHRVLCPGGWLVFSAHNRDGRSYGQVPWRGWPFPAPRPYRAARWVARLPLRTGAYARSYRNWLRNRRLHVDHGAWAMATARAHEYGIVIHYVRLEAQVADLRRLGFAEVEVFGSEDGAPVAGGDDLAPVRWFHFAARRPA